MKHERDDAADHAGARHSVDGGIASSPSESPSFAHPSETEFAQILDSLTWRRHARAA